MPPSRYIDRHAGDLLALLQRLVRLPTVNPPGRHYDEISGLLGDELRELGFQVRRYRVPSALVRAHLSPEEARFPRFNVLGRLAVPGAKKTLHCNAHYDVVPVSGKWRHGGPFSGAVSGGAIYGRGTADMKGSIAALLLAVKALRATDVRPRLNLEISFTADEETDSVLGTGWLVRHAPIRADYALVMEGGEGSAVCCGHNGTIWLEAAVRGLAAHGSTPEEGINALEKMADLVLALGAYKQRLRRRRFLTPEGRIQRPTINVGGVFTAGEGGKVNTVPAYAAFTIDRRVLPIESHEKAERELRRFLAAAASRIPQCDLSVRKFSQNFACFQAPKGPFFAAMAASVRRVRRTPAVFNVSTGFNDMHFFSHHLRIPTLGYGPGGDNEHGRDERVRVRDLLLTARIYADLLTSFAG